MVKSILVRLVAYIYFLVNSLGLPAGLLYTTLLSPLFVFYLYLKNRLLGIIICLVCFIPLFFAHAALGVQPEAYIKSLLLNLSALIFGLSVFTFSKNDGLVVRLIQQLIRLFFWLSLISLVLLYTPYKDLVWRYEYISNGIKLRRLILLTYESSYLSTLLVPLWCYALLGFIHRQTWRHLLRLLMISLPLVLAFSLGVLSILFISFFLLFFYNWKRILAKPIAGVFILLLIFSVAVLLLTENPLSGRINNIIQGKDTSGNARTYQSFILSYQIANLKSLWWGVGFGHIKLEASALIHRMWYWDPMVGSSVTNAVADTFGSLGIYGLLLRFGTQCWVFFRFKVYRNNYQLILFLFAFFYQFTGSYLANVAEYTIWALSARRLIPAFDNRPSRTVITPQDNPVPVLQAAVL